MHYIIFHGTLGSPEGNWIPWLSKELEKLGHTVSRPQLPTPDGQTPENWVRVIRESVESASVPKDEVVIIAHSMSCFAVCDYLSQTHVPIHAAYFIAGFAESYSGWPEPYPTLNNPFVAKSLDWSNIKTQCPTIHCFDGDDDKYVSQAMAKKFARLCGAPLHIIPGGGHLTESSGFTAFPYLLETITKDPKD